MKKKFIDKVEQSKVNLAVRANTKQAILELNSIVKDYIVGIDPYTSDGEGFMGAVWDNKEQKYIINGKG